MRHLGVLAGALLLTGLVAGMTLALGREAARERGRVTAIFRPGITPEAIMSAVARADGRLIRGTLLPFAVEVEETASGPGIAARLEAAGALLVVSELPTHLLAVGGCGYLAPGAYARSRSGLAGGLARPL